MANKQLSIVDRVMRGELDPLVPALDIAEELINSGGEKREQGLRYLRDVLLPVIDQRAEYQFRAAAFAADGVRDRELRLAQDLLDVVTEVRKEVSP